MTCKPCNKCKYCKDDFYCEHPNTFTTINYITCEKGQEYKTCQSWRNEAGLLDICGKEAKWFEAKPEKPTKQPWWRLWK